MDESGIPCRLFSMVKLAASRLDDLLVKTSRTFAISIPRLEGALRHQVTLAYLLFRIADTLEDAVRWDAERKARELESLSELLARPSTERARALADHWSLEPPLDHAGYLDLLAETPGVVLELTEIEPRPRALIVDHTRKTIACMAGFVRRDGADRLELQSLGELKEYCYAVAGIVGEMLTELFLEACDLDESAPYLRARAVEFGEALQLVNILKDAASDRAEGRSYLPRGVKRRAVFALARRDLVRAGDYVRKLQTAAAPRGLLAFTALPVLLAWNTLERVERDGPGAKLTRDEVARIGLDLERALDSGSDPVPTPRA